MGGRCLRKQMFAVLQGYKLLRCLFILSHSAACRILLKNKLVIVVGNISSCESGNDLINLCKDQQPWHTFLLSAGNEFFKDLATDCISVHIQMYFIICCTHTAYKSKIISLCGFIIQVFLLMVTECRLLLQYFVYYQIFQQNETLDILRVLHRHYFPGKLVDIVNSRHVFCALEVVWD